MLRSIPEHTTRKLYGPERRFPQAYTSLQRRFDVVFERHEQSRTELVTVYFHRVAILRPIFRRDQRGMIPLGPCYDYCHEIVWSSDQRPRPGHMQLHTRIASQSIQNDGGTATQASIDEGHIPTGRGTPPQIRIRSDQRASNKRPCCLNVHDTGLQDRRRCTHDLNHYAPGPPATNSHHGRSHQQVSTSIDTID